MKVTCDNCGSTYNVPDDKLVKPINKATCRTCGHRMMIPRPKVLPTAEERTLVTGASPVPASVREADPRDRRTLPIQDDDESEHTVPTGPPPAVAGHLAGSASRGYVDLAAMDTAISRPPTPQPPPRRTGTPAPARPSRTSPEADPRAFGPEASAFDPSGDLAWAALGTLASLFGAFLLSVLSIFNHWLVLWTGLALAFGGSVLTLMVLITGSRGRRPANTLVSVVVGFLVAVLAATGLVGTKAGGEFVAEKGSELIAGMEFSAPTGAQAGSATPLPAAPAPVQPPAPEVAAAAAPEPAPEAPPEPAPAVAAAPTPTPTPSSKPPPPSPSPAPPPKPTGGDASAAAPPPPPPPRPAPAPPPPAPAAMASVPFDVIQAILWNNRNVKACFVPLITGGNKPPRVDVKFDLLPSGSATNVTVVQPDYQGSTFEKCMASAVGGIQFPASSGAGQRITFPFVLQ